MTALSFSEAFAEIEHDSISTIRNHFILGHKHFLSKKENSVAYSFLELLCK